MKKVIKPEVRCANCGSVKEYEVVKEFCDTCGKKVDWNSKTGYPLNLTFILHNDKGETLFGESKEFHFCSIKCAFKWLKKNAAKNLKEKEDFFSLEYFNRENLKELFAELK